MLTLWNPFGVSTVKSSKSDERLSSRDYFDRIFEDTFNSFFTDLSVSYNHTLGMDYKKNEDGSLGISIDFPGVSEKDINVEIVDRILSVKAERKDKKSAYSVSKSVSIPEGYKTDNVKAELLNGVLTVTLEAEPQPEKQIKKIEVKALKDGSA